ncbi:hypothetical protein ACIG53_01340 [Streptomyces bauhiniae]|uniref:hypothetical protein n=1 Tax=Streptomyces bauhiniae TaxID=2340725 RepID=UPI0037D32D50
MRDERDDSDDTNDTNARGEVHWLPPHPPHDECPWCRLLLQPADPPPEPPPERGRHFARLRCVMVAFSALVTLVAAAVTLWRA